ncbi:MAG: DNA adenine methylase [Dehalococcoidia bacterium]|nr:DNA adenine methylase [Dehalococcoidia bacterium]
MSALVYSAPPDAVSAGLKAPFPYFGGKSRVAAAVWQRFGDPANYVEPFFGSGAVLLSRPHAPRIETVNDADAFLCNVWRAMQADPEAVARWADWPVNEVDLRARHLWLVTEGAAHVERLKTDPDYYDVKIAGWWLWGICQWIGNGWCRTLHRQIPHLEDAGMGVHRKMPHLGDAGKGVHRNLSQQMPNTFLGGVHSVTRPLDEWFVRLSERLRRVRVCCGDWTRVTGESVTIKHGLTAVFLDPPYSHSERESKLYSVETDCAVQAREWAVANGDNPLLRLAICGYDTEHEEFIPPNWERLRWKAKGGYGSQGEGRGRENAGRECIWFTPHCLKVRRNQMLLWSEEEVGP